MESSQQRLGRNEWWLWFSALAVTILAGIAFLLSAFPSLFLHRDHFYDIRSGEVVWAILSLLLLFNLWLVYRQWSFRRMRSQLIDPVRDMQPQREELGDPSRMDPVTGLHTRASIEPWLGKEVARARRYNIPLSLIAFHLDDVADLTRRFGSAAGDQILKEFAMRLKKASRGADLCVRLPNDDFLLVLPECSLSDAKIVSDRLGTLEMKFSGQDVVITYSVGWIDYKSGEVPSDLFKRAADVLSLYDLASENG